MVATTFAPGTKLPAETPGKYREALRIFGPLAMVVAGTFAIWASGLVWPNQMGLLGILAKWTPLLLKGFGVDLVILVASMLIGSVLGLLFGLALLSERKAARSAIMPLVQLLRNSPGIVFLFFVSFALPFKFVVFGLTIPFPGWAKVVFSFSLKISASVAEILRGSVTSIAAGQWDGGAALGLTKRRVFWLVIFPQCIPRMIPPWLNVVAIFLAAVPMASLVGIYDAVSYAGLAIKAEQKPELIIPIYLYIISWFFAVGYALHEFTKRLENKS